MIFHAYTILFLFFIAEFSCGMWGVRGGVQLEQNKNSEYVLLVSAASHHYETTAFFAYHLKKMNIPFVTWLHHYATMSFDGAAQRLIAHYSDNIHYLVPDEKIEIPPGKIKLLIYVTMNTFKETLALCPRKLHDELYRRADGVLMVNHYAGHVDKVWQYCKPPKCTLFHLSPFIHNNIKHIMQNKSISNYQSVGIDPVFEPPIAVRLPEDAESAINTFTHNTRLVVVQGAMVPYRRKYEDLFSCIAEIRNTGVDVRLFAIGSQGRKMKITEDMRQWLTVLRAVAHPYFYGAIARADFLVTFANPAYEYNITRASSSIPTAVMTEVPLVLTTDLLNKYDCLYGGSIHRRVADTDDCKALKNAIQLTDQERKTMREEIRRCKQLYLEEGQRALYRLIEHPFTGLEEDYQKSLELNKDCCKCFNSTTA